MNFSDEEFRNEDVQLDGNSYTNCKFHSCILLYGGGEEGSINNCSFNDVRWGFNDAAASTISFLTSLYQNMGESGKQVVDFTFEGIRKGGYSQGASG